MLAVVGLALGLLLILTGCAPDNSQPWFRIPIAWGNTDPQLAGQPDNYLPTEVRLLDGTHAELTDFPQGTSVQDSQGLLSLHLSTSKRYTGRATWSNRNGFTIVLKFRKSTVIVSAQAQFNQQDWTEMEFVEYGSDATWHFSVTCGIPGYGGPGKKEIASQELCAK